MTRAAGLLLLLVAHPALACWIAPEQLSASPKQLIDRSQTIALATVIRAERSGSSVLYTFQTDRRIRGRPAKQFQIRGDAVLYPAQSWDFNDHSDKEFWTDRRGRLIMQPDCKIHPSFSVGGTYLAFLDQPYHAKSFEIIHRIESKGQDKWLQYVLQHAGP